MSHRSTALPCVVLVTTLVSGIGPTDAWGAEAASTAADFSGELPRVAPLEPDAALRSFHMADGFEIQLVAAEPMVNDPVAMAFDENGRLYVVEMRGYSENGDEHLGKVRLLEDTDGDGRADRSTIFADRLGWPTGIACYDGGVFVGDAPDVIYFKDENGDGRADRRRVVLTGFGRDNVQGLLNSFRWGLDNRIHIATSSCGGEVRLYENAEAAPLQLNGRNLAMDPRRLTIDATTGGGQYGMSFNRWGDKFVCSNSNHLQAIVGEDRYVRRNPYQSGAATRRSIAADGPQAAVFRRSPVESWRIVRTRLRVAGLAKGPVEGGGTPAGYFTGSTGITIYEGDAWPDSFRGWAIVADVGSNLVHRKRLTGQGVTYVGHRVDEQSEFLASSDIWFRPVQFCNGPDGALYVADMYREVVEHPDSLPPEIKRHLDLTSGRDRGRIYRVVPEDFEQPAVPQLGRASATDLVAALEHRNAWHRRTAARLIYERQLSAAAPALRKLLASGGLPEGRIAALYSLDGLGRLEEQDLAKALGDAHPQVRRHAVRLAERDQHSQSLRQELFALVDDPAPVVRFQLAQSLGNLDDPDRFAALAKLARQDAGNEDIVGAVMSSLPTGAGKVLAELARDREFVRSKPGKAVVQPLLGQIARQQQADDVETVLRLIEDARSTDLRWAFMLLRSLPPKIVSRPAKGDRPDSDGSRRVVEELLTAARRKAGDSHAPMAIRLAAIGALSLASFADHASLYDELLSPTQPAVIQAEALRSLGGQKDKRVAVLVLDRCAEFTPPIRDQAVDLLASREPWLILLLERLSEGDLQAVGLAPSRLKAFASHPSQTVQALVERLESSGPRADREEVFQSYRNVLEATGDALKGQSVFKKNCSSCHRLEGVGHTLGPNLAALQNRGAEAILYNTLVPNREVDPKFLTYVVTTVDGRVLTGVIADETSTGIKLVRADGAGEDVLRVDIDEMSNTGKSIMPEGLEKQINRQAMADLLAYVLSVGEGNKQ